MNQINRLAGLVAALVMTVVSMPASAAAIDDIVFFGDSLSDTGNIWYATGGADGGFPPFPYFQGSSGEPPDFTGGQWSGPGGPSWPTLFASTFGLTATPSLVPGGNNYAWGGARTGVNEDPLDAPWLDQQVMQYLSGSEPDARTLVSIMIGGNDVASNLGNAAALEAGITSIITQIANLYGAGVRQFLISNVPDVGATPRFQEEGPEVAAFATLWTMRWNAALKMALDQLQLPGAVISSFDLYSFSKDPELLAMFANTTDACLTASSICSDPASYFYWDSFHPSSTSHALLAEALHRTAVAALLQQLLADVTGVGPGKSLAKKVTRAQAKYASRDIKATCGVLKGFMNQVKAQARKKLTKAQATEFKSDAIAIREAIGCN